MSEFNFDKMRNLSIPDEWAEKTIIKANQLSKPVFWLKARPMRLSIYLSLLVICLIGVFTFSLPQSNPNIQRTPKSTESTPSSHSNNSVVMSQQLTGNKLIIENFTESESENVIDSTDNIFITEPTEKELSDGASSIQNGSTSSGTNSNSVIIPPNPTEETQYKEWLESYYFHNIFMLEDLAEDRKVYCKIYSEDEGRFLGDPDLFSDEHLTEFEYINDTYCEYRYYPIQLGVLTKNGVYNSYYYNSRGEIFFTNSFFFTRFKED